MRSKGNCVNQSQNFASSPPLTINQTNAFQREKERKNDEMGEIMHVSMFIVSIVDASFAKVVCIFFDGHGQVVQKMTINNVKMCT